MTVGELIEKLKEHPKDSVVVIDAIQVTDDFSNPTIEWVESKKAKEDRNCPGWFNADDGNGGEVPVVLLGL